MEKIQKTEDSWLRAWDFLHVLIPTLLLHKGKAEKC